MDMKGQRKKLLLLQGVVNKIKPHEWPKNVWFTYFTFHYYGTFFL